MKWIAFDCLLTSAHVKEVGYIMQQVNCQFLTVQTDSMCLKQDQMGECKDLNDFDKGWIVIAKELGQNISKTAGFLGWFQDALVSTIQKLPKGGKTIPQLQGHGAQGSLIHMGWEG